MSREHPKVVVLVAPDEPEPPDLDVVRADSQVTVVRDASELSSAIEGADVLAVYDFRTTAVEQLGDRATDVAWIHATSAGVDAVMTPAVRASNTLVTNARGVFDRPIAEYVLGLLLFFCKDMHTTLAHQREHRWQHRETHAFAGRRVLVVGAGSIGSEVARLAWAAGAEVRGIARDEREDPIVGDVYAVDDLYTHLEWADDVVVCLPLTAETEGLFGADAFKAMRPGATFVNVGRGPIVDEDALVGALQSDHLGAAGLDVFEEEPLDPDSPLWEFENVVVSPHMAGDEIGWRGALTRQFARNLTRWRAGEPLQNVVHGQNVSAGSST